MAESDVAAAQLRKALKIERTLRESGWDGTARISALTTDDRRLAEQVAGVRISSDVTWAMVGVLLDSPREPELPTALEILTELVAQDAVEWSYDGLDLDEPLPVVALFDDVDAEEAREAASMAWNRRNL